MLTYNCDTDAVLSVFIMRPNVDDLHASLHDFASYLLYHVVDCGSVGRGSHGSWVKLLMGQMGHGSSHVTHCLL